jgi:hypothetical protein
VIGESNESNNSWQKSYTWQAPVKPNLVPYQPSGWDSPIVPSSVKNTTRVNDLYEDKPTYIDWAVINNGGSQAVGRFDSHLFLDSTRINYWMTYNLQPGYYRMSRTGPTPSRMRATTRSRS